MSAETMKTGHNVDENSFTIFSGPGPDKERRQDISVKRKGLMIRDSYTDICFPISFRVWWELCQYLKQFHTTYSTGNVRPPLGVSQCVCDDVHVCTVQVDGIRYLDILRYCIGDNVPVPTKDCIRLSSLTVSELVFLFSEIEDLIQKKGAMFAVMHSLPPTPRGAVNSMIEWCDQKIRMIRDFYCHKPREEWKESQLEEKDDAQNTDKVFVKVFEKMDDKEVRDIFFEKMGYNLPMHSYYESMITYRDLIRRFVKEEDCPDSFDPTN